MASAAPEAHGGWRQIPLWGAISAYWLVSVFASRIQRSVGLGEGDGVGVIAVAFFVLVAVCMATQRTGWRPWKRLGFVLGSFVAHVVLTVPAAAALGVLRRSDVPVRTAGEQRAVFLLASIPILVYAVRQSYLFVRAEGRAEAEPTPER